MRGCIFYCQSFCTKKIKWKDCLPILPISTLNNPVQNHFNLPKQTKIWPQSQQKKILLTSVQRPVFPKISSFHGMVMFTKRLWLWKINCNLKGNVKINSLVSTNVLHTLSISLHKLHTISYIGTRCAIWTQYQGVLGWAMVFQGVHLCIGTTAVPPFFGQYTETKSSLQSPTLCAHLSNAPSKNKHWKSGASPLSHCFISNPMCWKTEPTEWKNQSLSKYGTVFLCLNTHTDNDTLTGRAAVSPTSDYVIDTGQETQVEACLIWV